jgi:tetratricopeptide (TPR) repeat protein
MRLGLAALGFACILAPGVAFAADDPQRAVEAAAHMQRARAHLAAGDHTQAIAEQSNAIVLEPTAAAFKARALAWAQKRQCELAVADFTRAIELAPRDPDTYFRRAECLRALGQTDKAVEDLTQVLRFNKANADAFQLRAHVRLAQGRVPEALTDLRWAIDVEPRDVRLVQMLGFARFANADYEVAADNLKRSLRLRDDMKAMLLLYLARGRAGVDGRAELEKNVSYLRTRAWPFPILALYLGHGTPKDVLAQARTEEQQCEANFYIGHWLRQHGPRADGFGMLKSAMWTCPKTLLEYETIAAEFNLAAR